MVSRFKAVSHENDEKKSAEDQVIATAAAPAQFYLQVASVKSFTDSASVLRVWIGVNKNFFNGVEIYFH